MHVDEVSEYAQKTVARIAGAVAHELNNPLQGILSLVGITLRESRSDERCQARLEQIHRGVTRISRTVGSLAAVYENLPRPPDSTPLSALLPSLTSSLSERGFRTHVRPLPGEYNVRGFFPETVRLVADLFGEHCPHQNALELGAAVIPDGAEVICETAQSFAEGREEWTLLEELDGVSGMAVLIDELARLAEGEACFKWLDSNLIGIRLRMRTA